MIPLVFLQVLEPFCPMSEQENSEAEELEVIQPTCTTTVFRASHSELNPSPPPFPSDSTSASHKDLSCTGSLTETEAATVPLTLVAFPSFPDAELALQPPPPSLSDSTSASQPCLVSVFSLSNSHSSSHSGLLPDMGDSCILPNQTQSEPPISHPSEDMIVDSLCEILSEESICTRIENSPLKMVVHSPLQEIPNSLSDSVA